MQLSAECRLKNDISKMLDMHLAILRSLNLLPIAFFLTVPYFP